MPRQGNVTIYVVADDAESRVISAELTHRPALVPRATMPDICDYASLLRQLRNPRAYKLWEQASVTIVAQIDQHYSASFALSILELVKWAANPTSNTRLRLLTLSSFEEPEESIQRALEYFCPNLTISLVEPPAQIRTARAASTRLSWTDPESVDEAVKLVKEHAYRRKTSIVFCHPDEARDIVADLAGRGVKVNQLFNGDRFVGDSLRLRIKPVNPDVPPTVFFCTETSQIPMEIHNLGAIVISRRREAHLWEYGRIVREPEQTSQWEVDRAVSYLWQTSTPTMGITVLAPETSRLRKLPRRRVDNDQAIAFLVDLFANFDGMNVDDMLSCFLTDYAIFQSNMSQLEAMKCARVCDDDVRLFSLEPGAGQELLLDLLPLFQYQFLPAWFLATGITLPGVSLSAKRAMTRLAVIVHEGVDFIDRKSALWQERSDADKVQHLRTLASKIVTRVQMPHELIAQGGLWLALAAWHCASMHGFRKGVNASHRNHLCADVATGGIVSIQTRLAKRIGDLVHKLEGFVGIGPQDRGNRLLVLDENDCKQIQTVMVQTWMHRTVGITKGLDANGIECFRATDMVSMDTTLHLSGSHLMPIRAMMGSHGTGDEVMLLAALSLSRPLRPRAGIQFGAGVVLPAECIREWQNKGKDRDFLVDIRCHHPLCDKSEV
ncbi:hypothetical protein J3458_022135 [Metarhizium acridum]|uniref:uncharacterized protein n=1 Tax=Metarhizium acridum TaxID=92637 RepID=UPI001C6C215B|nr:hypothetical protein J3458_022135 [Metarhizium acridum]